MENDTGSLRDAIAENVEIVENGGDLNAPRDLPQETEEQPQGRTANRLRDESGRLLPGKKEVAAPATPSPQTDVGTEPPTASQVAATPIQRPSSWKKEYWEKYDNIAKQDPDLANYIIQREREFASGVSAFKAEAENAKQLNEAIAPFLPKLQQHGIQPTTWIRDLGTAHEILALGSPQEKVMMGVRLIRDYGIDPQALFNVLSNPQAMQQMPVQPQFDPRMITTAVQQQVQEALTTREIQSEYERFVNAKDENGQPKYPHFEAVKETMAGLLQAELAQDYQSAYEAAIRHPRHSDIFQAMQQQQHQMEEQKRLEASRQSVNRARSQAVSVKSATPSPQTPVGNKGLREMLSEAVDSVTSRV